MSSTSSSSSADGDNSPRDWQGRLRGKVKRPERPFSPSPSPIENSPGGKARRTRWSRTSPSENTIFLDDDEVGQGQANGEKEDPDHEPLKKRTRPVKTKTIAECKLLLEYRPTHCGSIGTVAVYDADIQCLQPGQFINDTIIDFWMSYIFSRKLHDKDKSRVVLFSSLFYQSLQRFFSQDKGASRRSIGNGNGKSAPTFKGLDNLFINDYIFVPVSLEEHWVLATICYPALVCEDHSSLVEHSKESVDELAKFNRRCRRAKAVPMIVIFDSFRGFGLDHEPIAESLRKFLELQWKERYGKHMDFTPENMILEVPNIPQQQNWYDCGIYLLECFDSFFTNPITTRLPPLPSLDNWFSTESINAKRQEIYNKIYRRVDEKNPERLCHMPTLKSEKMAEKDVYRLYQ